MTSRIIVIEDDDALAELVAAESAASSGHMPSRASTLKFDEDERIRWMIVHFSIGA